MPDGVCNPVRDIKSVLCRTGFATPSVTLNLTYSRDLKRYPRGAGDGVANPVRHRRYRKRYPRGAGDGVANPVRHRRYRKRYGRGCKPRPAQAVQETLRTGLQTPSGTGGTGNVTDGVANPVRHRKRYPRGAGDGVANPVRHRKRYPRGAGDGVANPVRHRTEGSDFFSYNTFLTEYSY
jgi:hypothetical protein